jgi:sigma-B regulation protein RsbU (phosphoserine phosphatase)
MPANAASLADRARSSYHVRWSPHQRVLFESIAAAVCAYFLSAAFEAAVIRSIGPTEYELAWISDVALAGGFGTAFYLWRHLATTRRELQERERSQLVVDTQLSIAADIQRQLLPARPPNAHGFEWAAELRSAGIIGGDFYDFMPFSPTQLVVLVADVSGKGIPAAMALGSLRSAFRALARQSPDPARIVTQLSAGLYDDWRGALYVTCCVATFDLRQRTITTTNAGHPPAIVKGRGGLHFLRRGGPPAGLFRDTAFEQESMQLHTGDACFIVTDGVTEALDGTPLEDNLERIGLWHSTGDAARLCQAVMTSALAAHGPTDADEWDDDRTVVVATVGPAPGPRGRSTGEARYGRHQN